MKKHILTGITILAMLVLVLPSCNDDDILDQTPLDRYSDAVVWSDINLANAYLLKLYANLDYGWRNRGHGYETSIYAGDMVKTKGMQTILYNTGAQTPDQLGSDRGQLNWEHYADIHRLNVFLANIDDLPEAYPESERDAIKAKADVLKGEGLFLRGLFYMEIMRSYGGVPLLEEPLELGDDYSGIGRSSFEETVNFIVKDFDDAAQLLKLKDEMEMGRANKEAALAFKSRLLLFAASDLTADGNAENELVGYINPDRTALWTAARDAAKAVMDLGTCELADWGSGNPKEIAQKCHEFFIAYTLADKEVIFGKMHAKDVGYIIRTNLRCGSNGNNNWGNNGPTGNMVDSYQMEDGSDFFDHFIINEDEEYINTSSVFTSENPYHNRDPRFYASILYDSCIWQPRFENLVDLDPLGIYDRRTRTVIENGEIVSERYGLDSRQGPVEAWNGGYSGYLLKKWMDPTIIGKQENNENIHIYIRYAEVLMNYAEACLELDDIATATTYINMIRNRAGLPDFTGDITEALRHERKIEFFAENIRWYDIRRWKILHEVLGPMPSGMKIDEVTEDGVTTTTWTRIRVQPDNNVVPKMYWLPIERDEINRAPQLKQNPFYN